MSALHDDSLLLVILLRVTNHASGSSNYMAGSTRHVGLIEISMIHDIHAVIPAKAGIQQDKNAFCLNPLDSRFRGNDVPVFLFP
jgi:hypothetical protein